MKSDTLNIIYVHKYSMINTKFRIVTTIVGKEGECGRGASILSVISFCYITRPSVQINCKILFGQNFVSVGSIYNRNRKSLIKILFKNNKAYTANKTSVKVGW